MKEWITLLKRKTITMGPPTRCSRHDIILPGQIKDQCYNSWKYIPTIISNRDLDLIGVRITQTQDAWEERCNTNCRDDIVRFSEMIYVSELWNKSSSVNQGEDEEVADRLSNKSSRFPKDLFPQLCEQRNIICQINWYNDVCSRENIHNWKIGRRVHPGIWTRQHDQCSNDDSISNRLRMKL